MTNTTARQYITIDLKSFYASEECMDRELDLFTNYEEQERQREEEQVAFDKERRMQEA